MNLSGVLTYIPRRALVVWAVLIVLTCTTWFVSGSSLFSTDAAGVIVIALAFGKVWFIGSDFMELRSAPRSLALAFDAYVVAVAVGLAIWYLVS